MVEDIYPNRIFILFNIVIMTFMATLDGSIVNVALPIMAKQLMVSTESISWIVTVYLIVISSTILLFGKLGDMKGKVWVFKLGIVIFTIGSLLCGFADSFPGLVFSRAFQAIGASGAMATSQGIITQVFPSGERGRALGIAGTSVALGSLVGPPLGGFMIEILDWSYIFFINVPVGIAALLIGARILPDLKAQKGESFDYRGALLIIVIIVFLFGSLIIGEKRGYTDPLILAGLFIACAGLVYFISYEKNNPEPLLNMDLFSNKLFSLSIFCAFISFLAISCVTIIQPFYLQNVLYLSPGKTGVILMTFPLVMAIVAPLSGYMSDKIGSEILTFCGLLLVCAGLLLMAGLDQFSSVRTVVLFVAVISIGNALFQSPNTSLIMSQAPTARLGIAGSVNALVRNTGMVAGISISTIMLYNQMSKYLGKNVESIIPGYEDAFILGMKTVYLSSAVVCAIGAFLTAYRLYKTKGRSIN